MMSQKARTFTDQASFIIYYCNPQDYAIYVLHLVLLSLQSRTHSHEPPEANALSDFKLKLCLEVIFDFWKLNEALPVFLSRQSYKFISTCKPSTWAVCHIGPRE